MTQLMPRTFLSSIMSDNMRNHQRIVHLLLASIGSEQVAEVIDVGVGTVKCTSRHERTNMCSESQQVLQ